VKTDLRDGVTRLNGAKHTLSQKNGFMMVAFSAKRDNSGFLMLLSTHQSRFTRSDKAA
jgi:hypothetical protein